jgi:transposase InsO family protein
LRLIGHCQSEAWFSYHPQPSISRLQGDFDHVPADEREARVLIEQWRVHNNTIRPHSALGFRPPAAEIIVPGKELPMNHEAA